VPGPFTTVAVAIHPPIAVPDSSEVSVTTGRGMLETALRESESAALALLRGSPAGLVKG
jgi:hypothetical protein